jgi:nucleotide-binding universal stress UspA family protein
MRVLLATDGSDDARTATSWLAQFPLAADTRVRVVHALSIPPSALDVPTVREFNQALRDEGRRIAEAAKTAVGTRFPGAEAQVSEGDPREVILRVAEEWPADLIVLGARGLGAVAGFLLGSVSLGVSRHARASVLVVKGGVGPLHGALVAVDGSEHANAAAAFLAGLPLDPNMTVRLVGVVEPPGYPATAPALAIGLVSKALAQMMKGRRTVLDQALAKAATPFANVVQHVERQVLIGHPVDQLVGATAKPGVDLVVLGARGLGAIQRLLLGSVSEGVLRHVDRPVLIVKGVAGTDPERRVTRRGR